MSCRRVLRQLCLVVEMVGLEGGVMLEILFMIANLQTLGVPVWLTSVPGTVSAIVGIFLIPGLGVLMDRVATSTAGKAKILVLVSSIHLLGLALVCGGNLLLIYELEQSDASLNGTSSHVTTEPVVKKSGIISNAAILVMVGYACVDCGFDASNCFLKTFALACTPSSEHFSIIVKNVLISTLGGCIVSIISAVGVARLLTHGSDLDPSAVQAAICAALCFILVLLGLVVTLVTGLCCSPGDKEDDEPLTAHEADAEEEVNKNIFLSRTRSRSFTGSRHVEETIRHGVVADIEPPAPRPTRRHTHRERTSTVCEVIPEVIHEEIHAVVPPETIQRRLQSDPMVGPLRPQGCMAWLRQHERQVILNISTFFIMSSLYAFMVYVPNFVGRSIYHGDPNADLNSDEYNLYIKGIEFCGAGFVAFYVSYSVTIIILQMAISFKGLRWSILMSSLIMAGFSLGLALSEDIVLFFLASAWVGLYRAVACTVPYILANQFAIEQIGGWDSGMSISAVAAMLPLGFTLTSALMGPLIQTTGNNGAPLFFCSVTALLGFFSFTFLAV